MAQTKRRVPIPHLTKEESQELDYGYDKVISHLLMETTKVVANIDKNKDGLVSQNEYIDVLWQLQLLESALSEHLKKTFRDEQNKRLKEFNLLRNKIDACKPEFDKEEVASWGFRPNNVNNKGVNQGLLFKRFILGYYRSLFGVASQLKFIRSGGEGVGG